MNQPKWTAMRAANEESKTREVLASAIETLAAVAAITVLVLAASINARAGEPGVHLAVSGMAFMNASEQGGKGTSGSTVLSQQDLIYHGKWWGVGAFSQVDRQGANETDISFGPKIELHTGPFYLEGGWGAYTARSFTDRSIAQQKGSAWIMGAGVRVPLSGGGPGASAPVPGSSGGGGMSVFLQFAYKYRIQNLTEQDGAKLSDAIVQKDGYPLFGLGLRF